MNDENLFLSPKLENKKIKPLVQAAISTSNIESLRQPIEETRAIAKATTVRKNQLPKSNDTQITIA